MGNARGRLVRSS